MKMRALVESVVRDVLYACRLFRRAPLVALTIVTTVGLGLGLVAVVFTLLNAVIFRVDGVRNPRELFAVERQRSAIAEPERFTRPQYEALVRETGVFSDTFARGPAVDSWIDGQRMQGSLVTGNFFHVLGVSAARGRTLTLSDDEPGAGRAIVLSHRGWSRLFASDPGVLNRTLVLGRVPFQVAGVMPEGFRGLELAAPDFWAPLSLLGEFRPGQAGREDLVAVNIIGRLKPGVSRERALAELLVWDSRRAADVSGKRPVANLVLEPRQGTVPLSTDALMVFTPLFIAFGLILMVGCANVANLLLARAVARQREIAIRLSIGALRSRIIGQLLTESLLLALVSAALAFGISRLVLEATLHAFMSTLPPDLGDIRVSVPPADWRVAVFLVAGAFVTTVLFALAPALQATRLELVRAMRGEVVRDPRPSRARNGLVALQVTASVLLLICSAVFLRSALAAARFNPGFRTADTLIADITNEQMRGAMLDVVKSEPSIAAVAATWPGVIGGRAGFADGGSGKSMVAYKFVSPEYFSVLDIAIVRGRGFVEAERSARAAVAVVTESVARQLWPAGDAIGQVLRLEPDPAAPSGAEGKSDTPRLEEPPLLSRTFVVVGIARDVPGFRFAGQTVKDAGIYVPTSAEVARTSLAMRAHGDPERARVALVERLTAIDLSLGSVITLRTIVGAAAYFLQIAFWLTVVLGGLALLLTLSGLFGVLSYLVEQRTREIGVRMAIGATSRSIGALVLRQSARPVGIGLLLGSSLAVALGAVLRAPLGSIAVGNESIVRLFDPVAYAASLLCIVTACACAALVPALRAGRINPVAALRQD